ncbi:hypothetical protein Nepgr_030561 [Nepenthes gracilis]|uniref:AB hydrolase-1 domain-containing protein n=1 Tax=Nepenthes gracilis TaxID=150966 RepID=A0AAD3TGT0_NEPGR|nr:hypothetical protein Nepgr_030561 [Nepenthes gracilis]
MATRTIRSKLGLVQLTWFWNRSSNVGLGFNKFSKRSVETLAFEEVRASNEKQYNATAFVLHGLLGSGRNWRSFARSLASDLSSNAPSSVEWRIVLVDLRNHGRSAEIQDLHPPHNMMNAAKDLANLVKSQDWPSPDVIIGHSMGGKVALQFAESCMSGDYGGTFRVPKQLWILDSVAGAVTQENADGEVEKVLQTLQSLPSSIPSRKWLVDHMMKLGFSRSLSEWIGSNLKNSGGDGEAFAFSLNGAIEMFNSYREADYWSLLEHPPKGTEILMVQAENSDRWDPEVVRRLERLASRGEDESEGKVTFHVLPKAGHWVHVDNPKGLLELIASRIASLA